MHLDELRSQKGRAYQAAGANHVIGCVDGKSDNPPARSFVELAQGAHQLVEVVENASVATPRSGGGQGQLKELEDFGATQTGALTVDLVAVTNGALMVDAGLAVIAHKSCTASERRRGVVRDLVLVANNALLEVHTVGILIGRR